MIEIEATFDVKLVARYETLHGDATREQVIQWFVEDLSHRLAGISPHFDTGTITGIRITGIRITGADNAPTP